MSRSKSPPTSQPPSPVIQWRQAVLASDVGHAAAFVAVVLSTHMDANGGSCFPSYETIARESRQSKTTVQRAVVELERAGLLSRARGSRRKPTRYRAIHPECSAGVPLSGTAESPECSAGVPEDVQEDVQNISRTRTQKPRARREKQARRSRGGAQQEHDHDFSELDEATVVHVDDYAGGQP